MAGCTGACCPCAKWAARWTCRSSPTKTKVGLILADVGQAMFLSRLREVEDFEVGLLRAEFMLGNIGVHPQALEAFDSGELDHAVLAKLRELDSRLSKILREQLAAGLIAIDMKLREYVITALSRPSDTLRRLLRTIARHIGLRGNEQRTQSVAASTRTGRVDSIDVRVDTVRTGPASLTTTARREAGTLGTMPTGRYATHAAQGELAVSALARRPL